MPPAWQLQEAKNRFSELVDDALRDGPQTVTRRGEPVVVVVSAETWRAMQGDRPRLKDWLRQAPLEGVELGRDRRAGRDVELP